jgi:hypothetical protein
MTLNLSWVWVKIPHFRHFIVDTKTGQNVWSPRHESVLKIGFIPKSPWVSHFYNALLSWELPFWETKKCHMGFPMMTREYPMAGWFVIENPIIK